MKMFFYGSINMLLCGVFFMIGLFTGFVSLMWASIQGVV